MLKRKSRTKDAHPHYISTGVYFTLKLVHGGMSLCDTTNIEYIGDTTTSVFDFVDTSKWSLDYLSALCVRLGFNGSKKFFASLEGKLVEIDTDGQAWLVLKSAKDREFTIYLEGSADLSVYDSVYEMLNDVGADDDDDDDTSDKDFSMDEDSCDEILDTILFDESVFKNGEFKGIEGNEGVNNDSGEDSSDKSSEDANNDRGFESIDSEEEDTSVRSNLRNFQIGQKFISKDQFKDDVINYAVKIGRPCKFPKNDTRRIYAKCKSADGRCGWHIHALKVTNENTYQIRELDLNHVCARQFHISHASSSWLAKRFETSFRCDPKRTAASFRKAAMLELGCSISKQQAFRAKQKALKMIERNATAQYKKLWDYAEVLRVKNPGSTIILKLDDTPDGKVFKSIYVCLDAVKRGFRSGCRPWIGVDGCHLTGPNAGVLLTAVGIDPNNCPYPLAYAIVTVENKINWEWFLELLKEDLIFGREDVYVFMSDKQKGLIGAFEKIMPTVENRFCVRHLHGNMKRAGFRGEKFKKLLWRAANSTTVPAFTVVMEEMLDLTE